MEAKKGRYADWAARARVPLGLALSLAYLALARPTVRLLEAGGAVALVGVALRAWSAGYLEKSSTLATAGPYAFTRNPLYLGSGLIGSGFALAGRSAVMAVAFAALFIFIYAPVMRNEERFLKEKFGENYQRYAQRVPLFLPRPLPRPARPIPSAGGFRWSRYKRNHEYEAALGYAAGMGALVLKLILR